MSLPIPLAAPQGCWFANITPEISLGVISVALLPEDRRSRGPGASRGKSLSYFCQYPNSLPEGVREAAIAAGIHVPYAESGKPYERSLEFRRWVERLFSFHGIPFDRARFFKKEDDEEEQGYRIVGCKRVIPREPLDVYTEFIEACQVRAQALPELIRPKPHSDEDKLRMLTDIIKEAKDRQLCSPKLKVMDLNTELFFV